MQNAEEEGVEFVWLSAPKGFYSAGRRLTRDGAEDAPWRSGCVRPPVAGSDRRRRLCVEPADLVIQALGFEPEALASLWGVPELKVTRWGTIKADFRTHETSLPGVYAAGDIVRGASLVVWAIRDGREAADAILGYLSQTGAVAAE